MEKYIDDVVGNLHKEIKFCLSKDITNNKYGLRNLITNYYTFTDKDYIREIKNDICDRYPKDKSFTAPDFKILSDFLKVYSSVLIGLGIITYNIYLIGIGAIGLGFRKGLIKSLNKKQSDLYSNGQLLEGLEINKWENIFKKYKKEYLEIIK